MDSIIQVKEGPKSPESIRSRESGYVRMKGGEGSCLGRTL